MFRIENWALAHAAVLACYIEVAPFRSSGFKDQSESSYLQSMHMLTIYREPACLSESCESLCSGQKAVS